jgi:hypothetical protein
VPAMPVADGKLSRELVRAARACRLVTMAEERGNGWEPHGGQVSIGGAEASDVFLPSSAPSLRNT